MELASNEEPVTWAWYLPGPHDLLIICDQNVDSLNMISNALVDGAKDNILV